MSLALKIVLIVLAALAVVAILASCVVKYMENAAKHAKPKENLPFADKVELVSHRGLGCIAPENTASAFTKAGEYGFKYCECDIHQSADGEFFVSHDATLNRMTDSEGEISEMTSQQILQAGINNGSNAKLYLGEKVPTLSRFLERCAKYGMRPVIEIKQKENFDVKKFCDLLKSKKLDGSAVVIGYNVEYLRKVREFLPKTELQILCRNISEQVIEQAAEIGGCGIDIMQNFLKDKDLIKRAKEKGLRLNAWTVDSAAALKRMYNLGIDMVTTNCILPKSV